jgi:SAM-dependent methyltransferase
MVGSARCDVLDLGAGAGALTEALAAAADHRVIAADPSATMVAELVRRVGVSTVECAAEQLPFAAARFDAVTVGTAFHWFDAERALPEIAKVLRREGTLGLAWNLRQEQTDADRKLGELMASEQPTTLSGDWGTGSMVAVEQSPLFGGLEYAEFLFTQRLSRAELVALVASRSYVMRLPTDRRARLLDQVRTVFDEAVRDRDGGDRSAEPTWTLTYQTHCWRANVVT